MGPAWCVLSSLRSPPGSVRHCNVKASSPLLLTSFRLHARGRSVKCDFLTAAGRALVFDLLKSGRVCYVHMAPPCSTASAARNISGGPTPLLRNAAFPDGLPSLEFCAACPRQPGQPTVRLLL